MHRELIWIYSWISPTIRMKIKAICKKNFLSFVKKRPSLLLECFWLLYILTSVWVLGTPNTSQNMLLSCFWHKKAGKKEDNWGKIWQKCVFSVCTKTLAEAFIPWKKNPKRDLNHRLQSPFYLNLNDAFTDQATTAGIMCHYLTTNELI